MANLIRSVHLIPANAVDSTVQKDKDTKKRQQKVTVEREEE